jgi:uncharacterized protein YjbJ (UPF0337 family)
MLDPAGPRPVEEVHMAKDWETEGQKRQIKGKVQEFVGEMIGDREETHEGKAKRKLGEIQEGLGQLGHKIDRELRKEP